MLLSGLDSKQTEIWADASRAWGPVRAVLHSASHLMTKEQWGYPTHEQELLALMIALEEWRNYILPHVWTDHNLRWYLSTQVSLNDRHWRWLARNSHLSGRVPSMCCKSEGPIQSAWRSPMLGSTHPSPKCGEFEALPPHQPSCVFCIYIGGRPTHTALPQQDSGQHVMRLRHRRHCHSAILLLEAAYRTATNIH